MPVTEIRGFFRPLIAGPNDGAPTPEVPPIVSKWRRLEQFDPQSQEYLKFLTALLDDRLDRQATTSLKGESAAIVLDILARVCVHSCAWAD